MPLRPNFIERRLVRSGRLPWLLPDVMLAMIRAQVVTAAMELGVFGAVDDGALTVESLAERTGADPDGMAVLVRALVALGYLTEADSGFRLTKPARRSLPDQDVEVMGTWFAEYMRQCADAADAIREAPADGLVGWETVQSGAVGRGYQATMRWLAEDLVDSVVSRVALPDGARRLLDVGGSHGRYTVRFCEEHPGLEGTVLDWEIGLDEARRTLADRPELADRIDLVERDFEREPLPEGYDVAFLGNIVHGLSPEGNRKLFGKLADATTERGTVAILDQITADAGSWLGRFDPTNSSFTEAVSALVGFNLFLFSGGRTYPYAQVREWLAEAGFPDVTHHGLRRSPGMSLVVARKPGG